MSGPGREAPQAGHSVLTLVTCVLASSLAFIDGSAVNVGLPAIGRSLGGGAAGLQWLISGYLIPLSALLLLGGALGDRMGRRRLLIGGVLLFGLASAGCGFAPDLHSLIAARFIQGVGAAMLMPSSLAILGVTFDGEARGRAIGIWAAAGAATAAAGPVLAGWLIDLFNWRMIFFINLPIAAGAIGLAIRYVRKDLESDEAPLDLVGAFLATVGLGGVTWGLIAGTGAEGWSLATVVALAGGIVLLAVFVLWEGRKGDRAMMPLALFGSRSFVGLTLLTLLLYGALGGLMVLLPYVLIEAGGYSSAMAGAALLPLPLVLAATSPFLGGLAGRIGSRPLLVLGPFVATIGFLLMLRMGADVHYWTALLPALIIISLGLACAVAPLTTAVLASADPRHTGSASGFNSAIARTGGLIATALLGGVLAAQGASLVGAFHVAVIAIACASLAASASAILTDRRAGKRVRR
jgi:EmrB/QacA subfamily drug resistance transporter